MKKRLYTLFWILPASVFIYATTFAFTNKGGISLDEPEMITAGISETTDRVAKPKMQVVFLLDATGSMSGLIGAAKEKIWSIASSLTQTEPAPDIEVGMLFYRDRGDSFITKMIPLGTDMDNLYEQLMAMNASGGGDGPESVNQALYEGVNKMQWDDRPNTYRSIFLVGDYPPHMDYRDDVHYPESCSEAIKKGIVINTILMGNEPTAARIWREIADKTKGEYIQTDMNVNNIAIRTPYDDRINKLQYELDNTRIYYGKSSALTETKRAQSSKVVAGDAAINARRAEYNLSAANKDAYYGAEELVNVVAHGKALTEIPEKDLPENMKKMSTEERETYLKDLLAKRKKLEQEIKDLSKQRQKHIDEELSKMDKEKVEESFDDVIYRAVQEQALQKDIKLEGKAKR
ncbi:vWA domain-containing protein [Prevotella sp. 10(H)]|uniref:vWA domain-containing protein n=1 Tax=Prevotella sp. 10(H) TaxID=1158294 RepID=UPI00068936A8|nr:vWA domain-containing protein [Prevotella sp. 10(H)]